MQSLLQYVILGTLSEEYMRLDNDFDENMKELTRYIMIICLVAIGIWFVTVIFKWIMPDENDTSRSMLKDNTNVEETLTKLVNENNSGEDNLFVKEDVKTQTIGEKTFALYVNELPDDIYFSSIYTQEKKLAEKRAIINKKVGENYIDSVLSFGTLVRWNPESFPLKVYADIPQNAPEFHEQEIKNAFQRWEDTTQGFISFVFVDNEDTANIICSYPKNFQRSCESNKTSTASRQYFTYDKDGNILRSNIELTTTDCNGETYPRDLIYAIILREIGHSLGLRGHSGNFSSNALYYPEANKDHSVRPIINKADINTLRLIYSIKPDKINVSLTDEQNKKLIKPEDVWGEEMDRYASNEKAMLYNLEMSPDVPDLYISLANYYKERKEYDKAIPVYTRSIVLMNDATLKSRVYARVGDTYNLQNLYTEAIEAYKLSLKNSSSNEQELFNVYFNLGVIYYKQNKLNDAIACFQNALKYVNDKENSYRLLVDMAELFLKTNNYINAMKCADKACSIKKTTTAVYLLAYSKYKNSHYEEAQKILEENIGNATAVMYALLAQIYYETQQFEALDALAVKIKQAFPDKVIFTFK